MSSPTRGAERRENTPPHKNVRFADARMTTTGKKIKERMQFLESKAAGEDNKSSTKKSPKSGGTKKAQQTHQRRRSSPPPAATGAPSLAAPHAIHNPFTPPMNPEDQPFFPSPSPPSSSSPPPFNAYGQPTYSPPSDNGFYTTAPHPAVTTWMGTAAITATAAPTLPPMNHFSDAAAYAGSGNSKGNESMSFASYGDYSLGVPATASPYDSNPHVSSHHHHHQHHQHHQASRSSASPHLQHESALLPPVSTFPSYGGSNVVSSSSSSSLAAPVTGHLAAPDLYRSRYPPPPPTRA